MKAIRWVPIALLVALTAACTASAGAETPPTQTPAAEPTRSTGGLATSVPGGSNFGLPTVVLPTATSVGARSTATAQPRLTPTSAPVMSPTARPSGGSTPTPVAPASTTATATPEASATATPPVTSAPDEPYQPLLSHSYVLPAGWNKTFTDDSTVLTDDSGKTIVTIKEKTVDRWRYPSLSVLGVGSFPERPDSWSHWSSTSTGMIKSGAAYEFQFVGTRNNVAYLNFIHWYLWGDILVEVSAEIPSADWAANSSKRNDLQRVMDSFTPHDGGSLLTLDEVLEALSVRLDNRPSGIYARNEELRGRVELTCRDIYETLLQEPLYVGNGTWQASAYTLEGVETWWVFEPSGTVSALDSNRSKC